MRCRPFAYLLSVRVKRSHTRRNPSKQLSQASIQLTDISNQPLINKIDQTFLWVFSLPEPHLHATISLPRKDECRRAEPAEWGWTPILSIGPDSLSARGRRRPLKSQSVIDEGSVSGHASKARSHWCKVQGILMQSQRVIINGPALKDTLENNRSPSKTCQSG